jgi:ribosome-associated heat shock protein Hsp15
MRPARPGPNPRLSSKLEAVRLDVWLDVACIYPTRSQAKAACEGGKVDVNGSRAKPHREIRVGDRLSVSRAEGVRRQLVVKALGDHSIPKAEARGLYEDVTPPPSPEVLEARRLDRLLAPARSGGRPDRRERRERRRHKGLPE